MKNFSFCLSLLLEISCSTFLSGLTEVFSCTVGFALSLLLSAKAFDMAGVGPDAEGSMVGLSVYEDCGNFSVIDF